MKVKEESGKVGLKLNSQKTKIMASGPISSWQTDREQQTGSKLGKEYKQGSVLSPAYLTYMQSTSCKMLG